jgi:hypothetical protein
MFCEKSCVVPSYGSRDLSSSETSAGRIGSLHQNSHEALNSPCCLVISSKLGQNVSGENLIFEGMLLLSIIILEVSFCSQTHICSAYR